MGYRSVMNQSPQTWQWECPAPVRADADSIFVPCSVLPDATLGDTVVVRGDAGGDERTGTITAVSESDNETFFRLALEP
jgi:hypothetical protein